MLWCFFKLSLQQQNLCSGVARIKHMISYPDKEAIHMKFDTNSLQFKRCSLIMFTLDCDR